MDHTEKGFEQASEDHLLHHGYRNGDPANFDASRALDTKTLVKFLRITQKNEWGRLNNSTIPGTSYLIFRSSVWCPRNSNKGSMFSYPDPAMMSEHKRSNWR